MPRLLSYNILRPFSKFISDAALPSAAYGVPHRRYVASRTTVFLLLLTAFLAAPNILQSQPLQLRKGHTVVSFDLNRLYNYNSYEGNRWGAGFELRTPLHYDERYGTLFQNLFVGTAYVGWGYHDHAWKWGGSASLYYPISLLRSVGLYYMRDLERVGNRSFDSYSLLNTAYNTAYVTNRYSAVHRISVRTELSLPQQRQLKLEYRHSREELLFNAMGLLYPARLDDPTVSTRYDEFRASLVKDPWLIDFLSGRALSLSGDDLKQTFWRLTAQYSSSKRLGNWGQLKYFCQAGLTGRGTPLSRRFDLSGTGMNHYYFYNTLLTVRPNTFMADAFVNGCFRLTTLNPIWDTRISKPHPFLQLNALWGMLWDADEQGVATAELPHEPTSDPTTYQMTLQSPLQGLLEPALGIDGLLRYGIFDFGIACAYQCTPTNAFYHQDNIYQKIAVMVSAKMIFELEL